MPHIQNGETTYEVKEDDKGRFPANCSICFEDKLCVAINYQKIIDICKGFDIEAHGFAVCEGCFKDTENQSLFRNLMDYFVMNELYRWMCGTKDGIVRSELEFRTLIQVAEEQGILYREDKRIRNRYTKQERAIHFGLVNLLRRNNTGDFTPNALYQSIFKKLYDG